MGKTRIPKKVTTEVRDYLRILSGDGLTVDKAFIFGSYAKGKQNKWSDIDLCIISRDLGKKKYPWGYLWKRTAQLATSRIEPVGFTPEDFVDESPLVWEIKQTGVRVK